MCGRCRDGNPRFRKPGINWFYGDFRRFPWIRSGEGDPRPWIWFGVGSWDLLVSPFSWYERKLRTYRDGDNFKFWIWGPFELNYVNYFSESEG